MNKPLIIGAFILIVITLGYLFFSGDDELDETTPENSTIQIHEDDKERTRLIIGNPDAEVTLIEYADFKCSACGVFHQEAGRDIRSNYIDEGLANIEFRALPIIGPDSHRTMRGAYCSSGQGIFSEYHDAVFDYMWDNYYSHGNNAYQQDILNTALLRDIAVESGADGAAFEECIESDEMNEYIEIDMALATEDGVRGTPTFKINQQNIVGPQPFSVFKTLLDIEIQS